MDLSRSFMKWLWNCKIQQIWWHALNSVDLTKSFSSFSSKKNLSRCCCTLLSATWRSWLERTCLADFSLTPLGVLCKDKLVLFLPNKSQNVFGLWSASAGCPHSNAFCFLSHSYMYISLLHPNKLLWTRRTRYRKHRKNRHAFPK